MADERRAIEAAVRVVSRLGASFASKGRTRATVVLGSPEGERGPLWRVDIAASLLRWHAFEVIEVAFDTPTDAFA